MPKKTHDQKEDRSFLTIAVLIVGVAVIFFLWGKNGSNHQAPSLVQPETTSVTTEKRSISFYYKNNDESHVDAALLTWHIVDASGKPLTKEVTIENPPDLVTVELDSGLVGNGNTLKVTWVDRKGVSGGAEQTF